MSKSDTTADRQRRVIRERIIELGLSDSELSVQLGKGRGYLHDFMHRGLPKRLKLETLLMLSQLLQIPQPKLGIESPALTPRAVGSGLSEDDAEPYVPAPDSILRRNEQTEFFTMKTRALDQHPRRILPGNVLAFSIRDVSTSQLRDGDIVLVQLYDRGEFTKSHGTVIRQFIAPNKLATNSSGDNEIVSMDDERLPYEATIRGVLVAVVA